MKILLTNAQVHTGETLKTNHHILIQNDVIQAVLPTIPEGFEGKIIDMKGKHISAGFIDTHINGGEKYYFTQSPIEETLHDIDDVCRLLGTTHTLPCLITSPIENILRGIKVTRQFIEKNPQAGVLGMHLEGPFLNPKRRGAHLLEYIQTPTDAALESIIDAGRGIIKIMTIAPELFTNKQLDKLIASGITIAVGHSDATYSQATNAYIRGAKLCTHLYNAMSQLQHRAAGVVGATFDSPNVYAPIIVDGVHCNYETARIAYKIKQDKLFLISDALFVNRKTTKFAWGDFDAQLINGEYRNSEGNLAGAAISMAEAVHNAVFEVGIPFNEAIQMATIRPAKAIGLDDKIGRIKKGFPAKLVTFDEKLITFQAIGKV
jgi:N-acetylglucosamine-6-phosphate deacetylase